MGIQMKCEECGMKKDHHPDPMTCLVAILQHAEPGTLKVLAKVINMALLRINQLQPPLAG